MGVEGEDLEGVVDAIQFIYDLRTNPLSTIAVGDKVAVIGQPLTFSISASDSNTNDPLVYSVMNSPTGARLSACIYRLSEILAEVSHTPMSTSMDFEKQNQT